MNKREKMIYEYFKSWINKDSSYLEILFSPVITYSECYGPIYNGLDEVKRWFIDWNKKGKVIAWDIKKIIHEKDYFSVEWYFKCDYKDEKSEFNGVSLIVFDNKDKIIILKEFQSILPYIYPYKI